MSTTYIKVLDGPNRGAWFKTTADCAKQGCAPGAHFYVYDGTRVPLGLPIKVSPSPEHWAKLLLMVVADQARVVIL